MRSSTVVPCSPRERKFWVEKFEKYSLVFRLYHRFRTRYNLCLAQPCAHCYCHDFLSATKRFSCKRHGSIRTNVTIKTSYAPVFTLRRLLEAMNVYSSIMIHYSFLISYTDTEFYFSFDKSLYGWWNSEHVNVIHISSTAHIVFKCMRGSRVQLHCSVGNSIV